MPGSGGAARVCRPPRPRRGREPAVRNQLRVVAVGFDGRPGVRAALETATEIALGAEATLRVISVTPEAAHGRARAPGSRTSCMTRCGRFRPS